MVGRLEQEEISRPISQPGFKDNNASAVSEWRRAMENRNWTRLWLGNSCAAAELWIFMVMDIYGSTSTTQPIGRWDEPMLVLISWALLHDLTVEMNPESSTGVTAQRMHVYYVILRETKDEGLVQFYFSEERVQRLI